MPLQNIDRAGKPPTISDIGQLDHYTVVVENADRACEFHVQVLGFQYLRQQDLNTGTVPAGEVDMINHILALPGSRHATLVITQGLNPRTIFQRYVKQFGPGIHHVAYRVDDLDTAFARLNECKVHLTSDAVQHDPLTGLRQIFIHADQGGYFIELIERMSVRIDDFSNPNMTGLAHSMERYLAPPPP